MHKYIFRVHLMSESMNKSGEGIEMEMRFYVHANSPNRARKQAEKWYWNLINKNPSLRLMLSTEITLIEWEDAE
jgi:hypothetical protein